MDDLLLYALLLGAVPDLEEFELNKARICVVYRYLNQLTDTILTQNENELLLNISFYASCIDR